MRSFLIFFIPHFLLSLLCWRPGLGPASAAKHSYFLQNVETSIILPILFYELFHRLLALRAFNGHCILFCFPFTLLPDPRTHRTRRHSPRPKPSPPRHGNHRLSIPVLYPPLDRLVRRRVRYLSSSHRYPRPPILYRTYPWIYSTILCRPLVALLALLRQYWPGFPIVPMGHPPPRNRLPSDLPRKTRTLPPPRRVRCSSPPHPMGSVVPPRPTHVQLRHRQNPQR